MLYQNLGYSVNTFESYNAVIIGYMMNYFVPRSGEVSRCITINKTSQMPVEKALGTVVIERLVDLFILVAISLVVSIINYNQISGFIQSFSGQQKSIDIGIDTFQILFSTILSFLITFTFYKNFHKIFESSFVKKVLNTLNGFSEGILSIRKVKSPSVFLVHSILIWIGYILMMYFCLFAMDSTSKLTLYDCIIVFVLGTIGAILPAPGAGAGTYHFFVTQALVLFGIAKADGLAYATLVHGSQMILLIVLGILASIYVMVQKRNMQSENQVKL
jgi:hypothetical protein